MIVSEVGRGVRSKDLLEKYKTGWFAMQWVDSTPKIWERTMHLAWHFDRQGTPVPIQDIHIAACAMDISAVLLSFNHHYRHIPGLTVTDLLY